MIPLPIALLMTQHLRRSNLNEHTNSRTKRFHRKQRRHYGVPYLTQEQWTKLIEDEMKRTEKNE